LSVAFVPEISIIIKYSEISVIVKFSEIARRALQIHEVNLVNDKTHSRIKLCVQMRAEKSNFSILSR